MRESDVHEFADVILPVAPQQEKAGAYASWEGRLRPFDRALDTPAVSDHVVLHRLAEAKGADLGTETLTSVRRALTALEGQGTPAPVAAPQVQPAGPASPGEGEAVLATWHHLLDTGRMQEGEPFLAGTAPAARARISAGTAAQLGVGEDDAVSVSTDRGTITLPVSITPMHDRVVWVPTHSAGSTVRATLGVDAGAVVRLTAADHSDPRGEA